MRAYHDFVGSKKRWNLYEPMTAYHEFFGFGHKVRFHHMKPFLHACEKLYTWCGYKLGRIGIFGRLDSMPFLMVGLDYLMKTVGMLLKWTKNRLRLQSSDSILVWVKFQCEPQNTQAC